MKVIHKQYDNLMVEIYENRELMGKAAAEAVAAKICELQKEKDEVRIVFASAPSQKEFLEHLSRNPDIDWKKVVAFNQDEWVGVSLEEDHSFGKFIKEKLYDIVHPGKCYFINGMNDMEEECERFGKLLTEKKIDIICLGVGENGHIAFNEPHEADFNDPKILKTIKLDERCRIQEFNDFNFASIDDVPTHGVTVTIPTILSVENIYTIVPSKRKAEAIKNALEGEITENCPASVLRRANRATLFMDYDAASLLNL